MIKLSFAQLAQILQLESIPKEDVFRGISIDTRRLEPGNLYVAIIGENFDGHDFLTQAKEAGAVAAIVSKKVETDLPCFHVPNTVEALGKITAYWRKQFKVPLVAITGSNGKTTVKNMTASIIQASCKKPEQCLVTSGNLNNQIGMPLNLLRLDSKHRYAVLEMGMNHFAEISYLSEIAQPDVAVITNAYPAHLEGVGTLNGVAQAKGEIFQGLSEKGTAILNADDSYLDYWSALLDSQDVITFGFSSTADVMAENYQADYHGSRFLLHTPDDEIDIQLTVPGRHNVMNALASAAACLALDIDLPTIKKGLEEFRPFHSRLAAEQVSDVGWVLDDTYNANPGSAYAGIDVLVAYPDAKILVLGDMKELGEEAPILHQQVGAYAKKMGVNYLLSLGEFAADSVRAFGENAWAYESKDELLKQLHEVVRQNGKNSILIKGSRSMKMEEIVDDLTHRTNEEE